MTIQKIMTKEAAEEELKRFTSELGVVDLDALCAEESEEVNPSHKRLIQAIMCGLVKYDDEKQAIIQTLVYPLKTGELSREQLVYKNKLTMQDVSDIPAGKEFQAYQRMLNLVIEGCSSGLLNTMQGLDFEIALACLHFFE